MKVLNFIICDDIRTEFGNKSSLMGIYNDSINFNITPDQKNQWPKAIRLGVYAQIKFEEDEKDSDVQSFSIEITQDGKNQIIMNAPLPPIPQMVKDSDKKGFVLNGIFDKFKFPGPGETKFSFIFYGKKNIELYRVSPETGIIVQESILK